MIQAAQPDVIVIGGGPAGATAATLMAQQGLRVEVFEREKFPRYHIGESLIPETYWVLKRLNMLPKLKQSAFTKKHSVQFINENGKISAPFYFQQHKDHESSQTWQVVRSEFDHMMLQNAAEHGATVHEEIRVLDVLFEGERAVGIQYKTKDGQTLEKRAAVIVDASGQSSLLINKLKLKMSDPVLNKGSIWSYYKGAYRDEGIDAGATVIMQLQGKKGWFWYIPLQDDIMSVGVVGDFDYLFKNRTTDHETTFHEQMELCPAVKERLSQAERVDRIYATKDFTYKTRQASGDGWVMVGDAFGFLDPLYSSGVLLALKSGELAADAVAEGIKKGDTSASQLGCWVEGYLDGMDRMRKLVCAYYEDLNFGRFIRSFPDHRGDLTDLLIGDIFRPSLDCIFDSIEEWKQSDATEMAQM